MAQLKNNTTIGGNTFTVGTAAYVISNGNVGIGTSLPTTKFQVAGNINVSTSGSGIQFPDGSFQTTAATTTPPGGTNRAIQYNNNGVFGGDTTKLVLDTNGNVGIGTTSPQAPLHVQGRSLFGSNAAPFTNTAITITARDYITGNLAGNIGGSISLGLFNYYNHTGSTSANIYDITQSPVIPASSTGPIGSFTGQSSSPQNAGSGNVSSFIGSYINPSHSGSGQVSSLYGSMIWPWSGGTGNITTMTGINVENFLVSTGNVTTAYGINVSTPAGGSGGYITGTNYGIYIGNQTGTATSGTAYNFYSAGATSTNVFDGNVGIGTASVTSGYKLEVYGQDARINGISVGRGKNSSDILIGNGYYGVNNPGGYNYVIGETVFYSGGTGTYNIAFGYGSFYNSGGSNNTGIGHNSCYGLGGQYNIAYGNNSLSGNGNGNGSSAVGYKSLTNTSGSFNTGFGYLSGNAITNGTNNTVIGPFAGSNITIGSNNTVLGAYDGLAAPISQTGNNYVVLSDGVGNVRLYSDPNGNVGIGTTSATVSSKLSVYSGNIRVGSTGYGVVFPDGSLQTTAFNANSLIESGNITAGNLITSGTVTANGFVYTNGTKVDYTYYLDDISTSFDGNTKTFNLTTSGSTLLVTNPVTLQLVIGGIPVMPSRTYYDYNNLTELSAFTKGFVITGNTTTSSTMVTFATAPVYGMDFTGIVRTQDPSITFNYKQTPFTALNIMLAY